MKVGRAGYPLYIGGKHRKDGTCRNGKYEVDTKARKPMHIMSGSTAKNEILAKGVIGRKLKRCTALRCHNTTVGKVDLETVTPLFFNVCMRTRQVFTYIALFRVSACMYVL